MAWNLISLGLLWLGLEAVIDALGYTLRWWERIALLWDSSSSSISFRH